MKFITIFLSGFALLSFCGGNLHSQNPSMPDSANFRTVMKKLPPFTIYGDNYFITGGTIGENPNGENADVKIQLGFKQRLTNFAFPWNTYLFFTYRQKAFWNVYEESSPFREMNYNPTLAIVKPLFSNSKLSGLLMLQMEHESNGRDAENSRSWNYISLFYTTKIATNLTGSIKAWFPLGNMEDNKDITDYRGYQQLHFSYYLTEKIILESDIQKSFKLNWKGNIQLGFNYRISKKSNQQLYVQYFWGYSEDLINYDQATHRIRVGIAFKDLFRTFRSY